MNPPAFFSNLKKRYASTQGERRAMNRRAGEAQNLSKRAIFALHREDRSGAEKLIAEARRLLSEAERSLGKFPELAQEGIYQAALEEYAEALLFEQFLDKGKFEKTEARVMRPETYFAALSDASGELARYAVRRATVGDMAAVDKAGAAVEMIIEFLLELDLTGYQRQKFDQAKRNLRSLEQIRYEVSLKR